jgi:hypothetical protein
MAGPFQLALRQGHKFMDVLGAAAAASIFTKTEYSNDLSGGQAALATRFPHL